MITKVRDMNKILPILIMLGLCTKSYASWEDLPCKEISEVEFRGGEFYSRKKVKDIKPQVPKDQPTCQEKAYTRFPNDAETQWSARVWCLGQEAIKPKQEQVINLKEDLSLKLNKPAKKFAFNSDHPWRYLDCPRLKKCPDDTKTFNISSDGLILYSKTHDSSFALCTKCNWRYIDYSLDTKILRTGFLPSSTEGIEPNFTLTEYECDHR